MKTYLAIGEITETSVLHGHRSGMAREECKTFAEAQTFIADWQAMDGHDSEPPTEPGVKVDSGDWTYWIEELDNGIN